MTNDIPDPQDSTVNLDEWKWLREVEGLDWDTIDYYRAEAKRSEALIVPIPGQDAFNIYVPEQVPDTSDRANTSPPRELAQPSPAKNTKLNRKQLKSILRGYGLKVVRITEGNFDPDATNNAVAELETLFNQQLKAHLNSLLEQKVLATTYFEGETPVKFECIPAYAIDAAIKELEKTL